MAQNATRLRFTTLLKLVLKVKVSIVIEVLTQQPVTLHVLHIIQVTRNNPCAELEK